MLPRRQAIAGDRIVRGLGRGGDVNRLDVGLLEQLLVIRGGGARFRLLLDFFETGRIGLREMHPFPQRMAGEGLRADPAAPAGADDGDFDRFHVSVLFLLPVALADAPWRRRRSPCTDRRCAWRSASPWCRS